MGIEVLERRFAAIGARVKVTRAPRERFPRIDVGLDRRGEFFELSSPGSHRVSFEIIEADRDDRCLLLLVRDGVETRSSQRRFAKQSRGPGRATGSSAGTSPTSVRASGSFCPVGRWPSTSGTCSATSRSCAGAARTTSSSLRSARVARRSSSTRCIRAGSAWPSSSGCRPRSSGKWREMVRDPELYAKGSVLHPDHNTIVLPDWHQVLMNTEQRARAMRHVAFLD
jgi:hypothetical protein